ncbi:MAG: NADPH-dependent oxidoreductase [Sphingobacteriales bacterium]|nr:MAG: NADPH-dependent oxidoreductase [Sphingobacteriales bacterium]
MHHIAIISSSVRLSRNSHRVALYFEQFIKENNIATTEILDLNAYQFPLFEERLQYMKDPSEQALEFSGKIKNASGVLIITPEYNGGYPASLKNAIDLLLPEWKRKPVAIASVSSGPFGGSQVNTSLAFSLWKIGALLVPAMYLVAKVQEAYNEDGTPADKAGTDKRAAKFLEEITWCMGVGG